MPTRLLVELIVWSRFAAGSHQNGGLWRDDDGRRNSLSQNIEESFGVKPSDLPGAVALETVPGDVSDRNCPWPRMRRPQGAFLADAAVDLLLSNFCCRLPLNLALLG